MNFLPDLLGARTCHVHVELTVLTLACAHRSGLLLAMSVSNRCRAATPLQGRPCHLFLFPSLPPPLGLPLSCGEYRIRTDDP
jgi:hypothetical protein